MLNSVLFIPLMVSATISKYVYVDKPDLNWTMAQSYCRIHHTDLAPVSNKRDLDLLKEVGVPVKAYIWFGMRTNDPQRAVWMWSGGGKVSKFFWLKGEPGNKTQEIFGGIHQHLWIDAFPWLLTSGFLCYHVRVIQEEKTWEDALTYCQRHHKDLASVASEGEMLLMDKELDKRDTTQHVWIGLTFLAGDWVWTDGQMFDYELWGPGEQVTCPLPLRTCGSLMVTETGANGNALLKVRQWSAIDCDTKLNFLCYG